MTTNTTCLLKLGGSILTDKSTEGHIDHKTLQTIAETLASCLPSRLLIVHGAGSCGHPEAKRYHLDTSTREPEAIAVTHRAVRHLNDALVTALTRNGLQALGVHPLHLAVADKGRLISLETRHIQEMLKCGLIPVLHGDVVMDLSRGACIISGDQLLRSLALDLNVRRVGLATDVPGVLEKGSVIPLLTPERVSSLQLSTSSHIDVTGGMKGKVDEMLDLARSGIISEIFHSSRLRDFLWERDHGGTIIRGQ